MGGRLVPFDAKCLLEWKLVERVAPHSHNVGDDEGDHLQVDPPWFSYPCIATICIPERLAVIYLYASHRLPNEPFFLHHPIGQTYCTGGSANPPSAWQFVKTLITSFPGRNPSPGDSSPRAFPARLPALLPHLFLSILIHHQHVKQRARHEFRAGPSAAEENVRLERPKGEESQWTSWRRDRCTEILCESFWRLAGP